MAAAGGEATGVEGDGRALRSSRVEAVSRRWGWDLWTWDLGLGTAR